jgi:hypothetical protein
MINNYKIYYFFIFVMGLCYCSRWQEDIILNGNYQDAIKNSIIDFSNTSSLFKEDSSFYLIHKSLEGDSLFLVSIQGSVNKFLIIESPNNPKKPLIPNNHFEYFDKLFYWYDEKSGYSKETVSRLRKFNLLDTVQTFYDGESINDDGKPAVDYYICKNHIFKYKKIETTVASGYYPPPRVKCN